MSSALSVWHLLSIPHYTGAAEPALTLCRDLGKRGHRIRFFADRKRSGDILDRAVEEYGIDCAEGPVLSVKASALEMLRDLRWLSRQFKGPDCPDLVHCHSSNDHVLCRLASRGGEGPMLLRQVHGGGATTSGWSRRWLWKGTAGAITANPAVAGELGRRFGLASERVLLLQDTVDAERFAPAGAGRDAIRAELGLDDTVPLVGLVARFRPGRGHDRLVRCFKRLRQRMPGAHLALIGRGEERPAVEALVRLLGLEQCVHFLGYRTDDLPQVYRALDLAVLLREGSDAGCRAVLEAMASGLPVVGTRRAAMPELIASGETGWLVADGDDAALVEALVRVLADPSRAREQGRKARVRIEARFGAEARAEKCEKLYLELTGRSLAPSTEKPQQDE